MRYDDDGCLTGCATDAELVAGTTMLPSYVEREENLLTGYAIEAASKEIGSRTLSREASRAATTCQRIRLTIVGMSGSEHR